jgi:hypothetical protein
LLQDIAGKISSSRLQMFSVKNLNYVNIDENK